MARAARSVTVLPATLNPVTRMPVASNRKRRVAAYARVSTDTDEQFTSYEAQIDYYTKYILSHQDWEFVAVYTDEGISGTNTKHRDGFNQMVQDALDGKIDLIVTKSVSRFARNTVDSLVTVRKLKDKGVEVFFEKENIYTLDSKGELLITIMSSLAQEESRSLSENIIWGKRKACADGKVTLPYAHFLGYRKGPDNLPEIIPEEAVIVQKIYRLFMCGMTAYAIAAQLTAEGIPTPGGKQRWRSTTINSILTNEKYKGDALLQKGFTVDFLTHKRKVNEGEVQQYYVEHSHPAIIAPEEWELVQREMERRKAAGLKYSGNGILGSRVVCGDCGGFYAPKTWHSTDKYRKVIYRCQEKYRGEHRCQTPALPESMIKERFVAALNELVTDKGAVLDDCRVIRDTLTDCSSIEQELADLKREVEVVTELARRCISENAQTAQDQEAYQQKYDGYVAQYEQMKARTEELEKLRDARKAKADLLGGFMLALEKLDGVLTVFDDQLWLTAVDRATVKHDGQIVFTFYNGTEITA